MATPDPPARTLRIELGPSTVLWALVTLASIWLFLRLWPILVLIVVALILVGTLRPVVVGLERRGLGRTGALTVIFLAASVLLALALFLTIPQLVAQIADVVERAPAMRRHLLDWLVEHRMTAPLARTIRGIAPDELAAGAGLKLVTYSPQVALTLGYGVTAIFLAAYTLADAGRAQGALYALVPRQYHVRLARILLNLETIVGGYVRGQLITSAAIALFVFVLLTAFQIPNALALAVFAGLTDVIPFVGGLLATTPAVLAALPSGLPVTLAVLAIMVAYQEFESRILVPRIYGRMLRLSPATVILALLTGGMLLGILGALLALPIAAGLQMIVREMRIEMPGDDSDHPELRARDERAEAAYEQLSTGAPAQKAAEIATEIAQDIRNEDAVAAGGDEAAAADLPVTGGKD